MNSIDNQDSIFPKGEKVTDGNFTGTAWVERLIPNDDIFNCPVYNVTFSPGARTDWHKHPGGQILLVTGGKGYLKEEGKPVQPLQRGDVAKTNPNVKHWHGATADSWFVHIAIPTNRRKGSAEWLGPVTDGEYMTVKLEKHST
ncbi:MAG: cupin domain-containing protein [Promethearchaeota archaeon]